MLFDFMDSSYVKRFIFQPESCILKTLSAYFNYCIVG
ncbi:MAG: hypothetical protein RIR91_1267, partial [Verrucomicrobiota bacterium]